MPETLNRSSILDRPIRSAETRERYATKRHKHLGKASGKTLCFNDGNDTVE
jgi:hypothetical protein